MQDEGGVILVLDDEIETGPLRQERPLVLRRRRHLRVNELGGVFDIGAAKGVWGHRVRTREGADAGLPHRPPD